MEIEFKDKNVAEEHEDHPDYLRNVEMAKRNFPRIHLHMPMGLNVDFGLDNLGRECFVRVSFTPPRYANISRIACILELHQPYQDLKKEMNDIYNNYVKYAKHFWDNYPINKSGDTVVDYKTGNIIPLKD